MKRFRRLDDTDRLQRSSTGPEAGESPTRLSLSPGPVGFLARPHEAGGCSSGSVGIAGGNARKTRQEALFASACTFRTGALSVDWSVFTARISKSYGANQKQTK